MAARKKLLQMGAPEAARRIARRDLTAWTAARRRLGRKGDRTALHDFRVALRRLRSTLRAFRRELRGVTAKDRRRLRRLARATDEARNLEVWSQWISRNRPLLSDRQQAGVAWLRNALQRRRRAARAEMLERTAKRFPGIRRELARLLTEHGSDASRRTADAGSAVRRVVREETRVLRLQLSAVSSMADRDAAHAARIAGKRLRYLLEEFVGGFRGTRSLVARLRKLQDVLGEVHDAHVFADELRGALAAAGEERARQGGQQLLPWPGDSLPTGAGPPPGARQGLVALARRLRRDGERRFASFQKWSERRKRELFSDLDRMGKGRRGNRGGRI